MKIITGKMHQIRLHGLYLHMPILGDKKYGNEEFSRLMLHSYCLNFDNYQVTADIPLEFYNLFQDINHKKIENILKSNQDF